MKKLSLIAIIFAGMFWGTMGSFARLLSTLGLTDPEKLFIRCGVSFLAILIYMLCHNRSLLRIKFGDIKLFLGTGVLSVGMYCLLFFYTVSHLDVSIATILANTSPAFVIGLSALFFKERITPRKLAALGLTVLGCAFVSGIAGTEAIRPQYLITGLLAGFFYSLYNIFGTVALRRYHLLTVTLYTFMFAALTAVPFIDFKHLIAIATGSVQALPLMICFGLVTALLPYSLYTFGLTHVEAGRAAVCAMLEPVMAACLGFFVFHEPISLMTTLGILLVLSGVAIVNIQPTQRITHEL